MRFENITSKAINIRNKYAILETELYGEEWSKEEIALGFVGDVGDLMKLIIANEGKRDIEKSKDKLAHELSDCLWSIIVLAHKYDINLEKSFIENMDKLEDIIDKKLKGV